MKNPDSPMPIPIPLRQRFKRALTSGLPIVFFGSVCLMSALLWNFQQVGTTLVGEVKIDEHVIASPQAGVLARLVPNEGQAILTDYSLIQENQLIAQLDDRAVRGALDILEQEILRLSDEAMVQLTAASEAGPVATVSLVLDDKASNSSPSETLTNVHEAAAAASPTPNHDAENLAKVLESQNTAWQMSADFISHAQAQLEFMRRQLELRRIETQIRQLNSVPPPDVDHSQLVTVTQQRDEMILQVEELRTQISFAQASDVYDLSSIEELTWPLEKRLQWQSLLRRCRAVDAQLKSITETVAGLDIFSDVAGQVEASYVKALQSVEVGTPLLTVVPTRGRELIVYSRENSPFRPYAGMKVKLRLRDEMKQQIETIIQSVGPKVELIPKRHRFNSEIDEWGRPMRVRLPADWIVEPGSLIDVIVTS